MVAIKSDFGPPADRDSSLFQLVDVNPVMYFCPSLGPAQAYMCKQAFPKHHSIR